MCRVIRAGTPEVCGGSAELRRRRPEPTRTRAAGDAVGDDGIARGRFPVGVDPSAYRYVDVSREADDGDSAHSRRSVLRSAELI